MFLIILLVFVNTANATFMAIRSVTSLTNGAEAIVVGSAQATITGDLATVSIQTSRVIKGLSNGIVLQYGEDRHRGDFGKTGSTVVMAFSS